MSIPYVPGYHSQSLKASLYDLWPRPAGDLPRELWPAAELQEVTKTPEGWLTVSSHSFSNDFHGGVNAVLVEPGKIHEALADSAWVGRDLGDVMISGDDQFADGLIAVNENSRPQFFVQCRYPQGARSRSFDVDLSFLWYWDAFQVDSGWSYVNAAGRDQELIRFSEIGERGWRIEVRALELRTYLAQRRLDLILQVDVVYKRSLDNFERIDDAFVNDWCNFSFFATHEGYMGDRPAFSGLMGQYVVRGQRTIKLPRWAEYDLPVQHLNFVYGVDATTGAELTHTSDPDQLGTYFDKDASRLHYLTPVYFKREVLLPYSAEPSRYSLSAHRLSCLGLWGVEISVNSAGLVEVYLGDIGAKIPSNEWGHWRAYNVPPEGIMDEGRYRRDFLNQWAESSDPVQKLQSALRDVVATSEAAYGGPLWKPLAGPLRAEFASLIGPLNEDRAALNGPILTLTKVMVDSLDGRFLKTLVTGVEKGEQSLRTLTRLTDSLGDEEDVVAIFKNLQSFRSRGGVAHLENSTSAATELALGISGLSAIRAFAVVVSAIYKALVRIDQLIKNRITPA
ncbi:hypothetical protein [Pseudonocardia sp.]|uniref:hypothetical protein n=1 Tax=Pseudonocardia sp. TaxID=60912 RepID=UPI003D0C957F